MKVQEIANVLNAKVLCGEENLSLEMESAFASDLMSDVLTVESEKMLLITGLVNTQAIRTAEMSDIQCVIFVRNKKVSQEMINLAKESEIIVLECPYSMFKAAGVLYENGLKPIF
jgi:predicted transcriptional regulator